MEILIQDIFGRKCKDDDDEDDAAADARAVKA